jgi:aryl-alcohol dehydrogenase-like predicted oxidoreductase
MYGFGHSERIVGEAIKGRRDRVQIATKCGLVWDRTDGESFFESKDNSGRPVKVFRCLKKDNILREADLSLERMGIDCIDLFQCHWPDKTTPLKETMEALTQLLREGKVKAIGVSNFTAEMIQECLKHGPVHSDQPPYDMLTRDMEKDVLPCCRKNNVGVVVYSPLHQGLLTGKVTMDRKFNEGDQRNWRPWFKPQNRGRVLEFLQRVQPIADAHNKTLAQVAINWCLCQNGITCAIVGARRPDQVVENAGGAGWKLTPSEITQIRGWLEALGAAQ